MKSQIFEKIGLANLDIAYLFIAFFVIIVILLILIIVQMNQLNKLKKKYQKFMQGKDGKSLEKTIITLCEDSTYLKTAMEKNRKDIRTLFKKMESSFQKVGIVKYDAFQQMGGKLSFSLALLNDRNDGFIINSVHSSDGCYSYTKEIINGQCEIVLGNEEKVALEIAMKE